MKIIDAHQHLWDLNRLNYSWCADVPHLNRSFVLEDYQREIAALPTEVEIVASIHVEANVDDEHLFEETAWLEQVAAQPGAPLRGLVASARPEREDFRSQLERLRQFPLVRGIRRLLQTQPDAVAQTPLFAENLRLLPEYGYSFDLGILVKQLPVAIELVGKCPQTAFVLDHCGVPDVKNRQIDPWRDHIKAIAAYPNVACKISGLVAYADPDNWTPGDLHPFIEHAIACFGWDRVLWGSDWPVCTRSATLARWLEAALELTVGESEENRRKLFHDNAARVYRLEV